MTASELTLRERLGLFLLPLIEEEPGQLRPLAPMPPPTPRSSSGNVKPPKPVKPNVFCGHRIHPHPLGIRPPAFADEKPPPLVWVRTHGRWGNDQGGSLFVWELPDGSTEQQTIAERALELFVVLTKMNNEAKEQSESDQLNDFGILRLLRWKQYELNGRALTSDKRAGDSTELAGHEAAPRSVVTARRKVSLPYRDRTSVLRSVRDISVPFDAEPAPLGILTRCAQCNTVQRLE